MQVKKLLSLIFFLNNPPHHKINFPAMRKILYLVSFCICTLFTNPLQAQWTKTNGLPGGTVFYFLNYGDTVLAKVGELLYFSSNEGQLWSPVQTPFQGELSVNATDGKNILVSRFPYSSQLQNIFRTDDFFQTLHPIALSDTISANQAFLADGYIYYSDMHHFYRTNDDGDSWEKIPVPYHYHKIMVGEQRLTMVNHPNIVQSTDGGFTWDTLLQFQGNVIGSLLHESQMFVFMQYDTSGCYFSNDYGQTWQHFIGKGFNQIYGFEWHNGSVYGFHAQNLIKSSNFGQTWTEVLFPQSYYSPAYCGISTGNTLLVGGILSIESASLYRSTDDAISWNPAATGIVASAGNLHSIDGELYAPSVGGLFQLDPDEFNWTELNLNFSPPTYYPARLYDFTKTGGNWLISDRARPWVSLDGGSTWQESSISSASNIESFIPLGEKVIGKGSGFAPGATSYFISHDHGISFKSIQSLSQQYQVQIAALDVDQGIIFVLASDKKIYRSSDGCDTWELHPIPPGALDILPATFSLKMFVREAVIIVYSSYSDIMHLSQDSGQSWQSFDPNLAGFPWGTRPINDLLYIGNSLVAATENGFFISQNDGTDWADWNDGFSYRNVHNLEIHDGFIWGATFYAGIWKRPLSEVGLDEITLSVFSGQPIVFSPNPANQSVLVSTGGEVGKLSLYDANGRIVLNQDIGYSGAEISVKGFPQGIYQAIFKGEKTLRKNQLVVQR